jgi:cytochrome c553
MTKSQIWVASFLVIFFILFIIGQITKEDEAQLNTPPGNPMPQSNIASDEISAPDLITRLGCRSCHGGELQGTRMGPALTGLSANWTRDELLNYLRNPNSFMEKARFKKFREEYPGIMMPSFGNVEVKDLGKISDYLLTL